MSSPLKGNKRILMAFVITLGVFVKIFVEKSIGGNVHKRGCFVSLKNECLLHDVFLCGKVGRKSFQFLSISASNLQGIC